MKFSTLIKGHDDESSMKCKQSRLALEFLCGKTLKHYFLIIVILLKYQIYARSSSRHCFVSIELQICNWLLRVHTVTSASQLKSLSNMKGCSISNAIIVKSSVLTQLCAGDDDALCMRIMPRPLSVLYYVSRDGWVFSRRVRKWDESWG